MSRHQGAQPGVQRALGWTPEPRRIGSADPVFCRRCGNRARIEVEAFGVGRTIEICDACGLTAPVAMNRELGQQEEKEGQERRERAERMKAALAQVAKPWTPRALKPKECALSSCRAPFQPKSGNQRYCSDKCRTIAQS